MSARGRFLSGLVTVVLALAGFVTVGALPAAAVPAPVQYVALGDSYAAGSAAACEDDAGGYPALLPIGSRIDLQANVACSGATADDVADNQLGELNVDTRLVTITVGAADLGLSAVLTVCTYPTRTVADCIAAIQSAAANLPGLGIDLTQLYAAVAEASPNARVMVTGYPHLFEPLPPSDPRAVIVAAINNATDDLNDTIEQAVGVANDADVNIHYVDVTDEFAGHGIFGTVPPPFIFPPGFPVEAFHPTPAGYRAYADAISVALPGGWFKQLV
jgi:lysophospholipase L1-like esterase